MSGINHFGIIDYIVVAATLLISLFIGIYYATISKNTTEDLLVGGRGLGALPVAASILVTYLSAVSILGYPAEVFYNGAEIFIMTLISMFITPLSAYLFVPVLYNLKLTSVYSYLEMRFDSLLARRMASFIFILQVVLVMAIILFAPSIAIEAIMGIPMWISITAIGISGTIYTSVGGLKAVVWTDVFQLVMILIGMIAILVKGFMISGGLGAAFEIADKHGRLNFFNMEFNIFARHNTLNFLIGFGFALLFLSGTHQPQVQRYSSLPTLKIAIRSIIFTIPMNVFTNVLIMLTGIAIFAVYHDCDPLQTKEIYKRDGIVSHFVTKQLAHIPGMLGLFIAVIFSAVLSTVSSGLNSLGAVTWEDFFSRIAFFAKMGPQAQANTSRCLTAFYGTLITFMAFFVINLGPLIPMIFTGVGATNGPLGAVFVLGLFLPFVNKYGALSGMSVGIVTMLTIATKSYFFGLDKLHSQLPTSIDGCEAKGITYNETRPPIYFTSSDVTEWPTKLYTLSYLLYSLLGAMITIVVAVIVSLLTKCCCRSKPVDPKLIHPLLRKSTCCYRSEESDLKVRAQSLKIDRNSKHHASSHSYTYYPPYRYEQVPVVINDKTKP
jgi:SSS family transporter